MTVTIVLVLVFIVIAYFYFNFVLTVHSIVRGTLFQASLFDIVDL